MFEARNTAVGLVAGFCLLAAVGVMAQPRPVGGVLVNEAGKTLYVFDNDATVPGKSACYGACLSIFRPYVIARSAKVSGDYGLLTRDDGAKQWTYKGKPLYLWYDDKKAGDKGGDGMRGGVWHVARP
jgi:predicted lipoprotein with Yx(FWY)xxD motif